MKPATLARKAAGWTLFAAVLASGTWLALNALRPWARWLEVSTPPRAIVGDSFPVRIRLESGIRTGRLSADLHARRSLRGGSRVIGATSVVLEPNQREYTVRVPVARDSPVGPVRVILYVSPTGLWRDRSRAAVSEELPLISSSTPHTQASVPMSSRDVFDVGEPSTERAPRPAWLRLAVTVLWLATGTTIRVASQRPPTLPVRFGPSSRAAMALGIACLLCAAAAASDLGRHLGDAARHLAQSLDAYDAREPGQQFVTALVLVALGVGLGFILVRARASIGFRGVQAAVIAFVGLLLLESLSLHALDSQLERTWSGVPRAQWLGLACAVAAVACAVRSHGK